LVEGFEGRSLVVLVGGERRLVEAGDMIVHAISPAPNRDVVPVLEAAGVDHVLVGDCNRPSDFLEGIRDAWMTALAIDNRLAGRRPAAGPAAAPAAT
jgi:hypothetical protein